MAELELRFPSKVDSWLILLLVPAILLGPLLTIFTGQSVPLALRMLILLPAAAVAALMLWILLRTDYTVTSTELVIRAGPIRKAIPLAAIQRISPSRSIESGLALSFDRLLVKSSSHGSVLISPADKAGFTAAISARAPRVVIDLSRSGK